MPRFPNTVSLIDHFREARRHQPEFLQAEGKPHPLRHAIRRELVSNASS